MSKQVITIRELSGGMSTDMDPSDMADNMATVLEYMNVDKIGRIARMRGFRNVHSMTPNEYRYVYTFNSHEVRSNRKFTALHTNGNYVSYRGLGERSSGEFPASSSNKFESQNNVVLSYGPGSNQLLLIPNGNGFDSRSISRNYSINVNAGGSNTSLPGSGSLRVAVKAVGSPGNGEWMDIITIYVSATLADGSESKLASSSSFFVEGSVSFTVSNNSLPSELDGFKVYYTHQNASDPHRIPDHDGDPLLLMEFKRGEGYRFAWENDFTSGTTSSHSSTSLSPPFTSRFSFISGFNQTDFIIERFSLYKFINNRGYAFNPVINGSNKNGAIAVSPGGKPNVFTENSLIEVSSSGDPYLACEHFNGLLYCFKENEINIISIASGSPSTYFLSETIDSNGVIDEFGVTKTETGVFWANRKGVFFHSGQKGSLTDLSKNRISDEYKDLMSDNTARMSVGYSSHHKKACVMARVPGGSNPTVMYHFDNDTGAVGKMPLVGSDVRTNLFKIDDTLCFANAGSIVAVDFGIPSVAGDASYLRGNSMIITKEYDMDAPSVRKKVRRFYISFDGLINLTFVNLSYSIDGRSFVQIPNNMKTHFGENDSIVMFDLDRSITAYSIRLMIVLGNVSTNFPDIKDISIIYRMKLPK